MITAGVGQVASMPMDLSCVAVQHFSGCPRDMGMCIVQAGNVGEIVPDTLSCELKRSRGRAPPTDLDRPCRHTRAEPPRT